MSKRTSRIQYLLMTGCCILLCLLLGMVGGSGAWFTSNSPYNVQIYVHIGNLYLQVYQVVNEDEYLINCLDDTTSTTASDVWNYVKINNNNGEDLVILPDTTYDLNLIMRNEDSGSNSMYMRYKVEFLFSYYDSTEGAVNSITLIPTITGYSTPTSSTYGFVYSSDGYYYYADSTDTLQYINLLAKGTTFTEDDSLNLMQTFLINYDDYLKYFDILSGNIMKILLTVDCTDEDPSASGWAIS